jgi:hypothetical protein
MSYRKVRDCEGAFASMRYPEYPNTRGVIRPCARRIERARIRDSVSK